MPPSRRSPSSASSSGLARLRITSAVKMACRIPRSLSLTLSSSSSSACLPPRPASGFCLLPVELQWQILSYASLSDLPQLSRVSSSLHSLMQELQSQPPPPSSPHSPSLPFTQPFSSLFSDYQHAKPLLQFLSCPTASLSSLLVSSSARRRAVAAFAHPPAVLRRILNRFPYLLSLFRRKQSRVRERIRNVDLLLSLLSMAGWAAGLMAARELVPALVALPMRARTRVDVSALLRCWWLLLYAAAVTWTDIQYEVIQRCNAQRQREQAGAAGQQQQTAADRQRQQQEQEEQRDSDDEEQAASDSESESAGSASEEEMEEAEEPERLEAAGGRVLHDADLDFQRRLLRRGEAILRAREQRNNAANLPPEPRQRAAAAASASSPSSGSGAAALSDAEWLSLTSSVKAAMRLEEGASLPLRLLTDALSAVGSECYYRYLLIFSLFFLFLFFTFSLRYFLLLDALRLVVEGVIPLIPLLAIARSLLLEPHAAPTMFSLFVDGLNRPSVIVGLRSLGLGVTLATNGGRWKAAVKRLCDSALLPVMDALMLRMIRIRRRGGADGDGEEHWISPFVISPQDEPLPSPAAASDDAVEQASLSFLSPAVTDSVSHLLLDHAHHLARLLSSLYSRLSYTGVVSVSSLAFRLLTRILLLPSFTLRSLLVFVMSPSRLSRVLLLTARSVGRAFVSYFRPYLLLASSIRRLTGLSSSSSSSSSASSVSSASSSLLPSVSFPLLSSSSPYLPSPSSSQRLFAMAMFIAQLYSRDDSRAFLLRPSSLLHSVAKLGHHWTLSLVWLRLSLTAGLPSSILMHALFNWTTTVSRTLLLL